MSADFTPSLNTYTDLTPFRFWCQKVLPLVYEDSLSYYELLCKVIDYLNKTMEDVNLSIDDVSKLHTAYEELQGYVNNYFDNLDVQEEINNKIDELVQDGTIEELFSDEVQSILDVASEAAHQAIEDIPENVSDWLDEHVDPETGYVIDNTLTIPGAAADAKKTGDEINALKSGLSMEAQNTFNQIAVSPNLIVSSDCIWNEYITPTSIVTEAGANYGHSAPIFVAKNVTYKFKTYGAYGVYRTSYRLITDEGIYTDGGSLGTIDADGFVLFTPDFSGFITVNVYKNAEQMFCLQEQYPEAYADGININKALANTNEDLENLKSAVLNNTSTTATKIIEGGCYITDEGYISTASNQQRLCAVKVIKGITYNIITHNPPNSTLCTFAFYIKDTIPQPGDTAYDNERHSVEGENVKVVAPVTGWLVFRTMTGFDNETVTPVTASDLIARNTKNTNPLFGKYIAVDGDSICYGNGYIGGYAKIIADNNSMFYQNIAVGGATIVTGTQAYGADRHWISTSMQNLDLDADYILIEGGANDSSMSAVTLGSLTPAYNSTLDTTTFYGALETIFKTLTTKYIGKKYGFILVHGILASFMPGGDFYNAVFACAQKWGVPVLDLQKYVPPFNQYRHDTALDAVRTTYTTDGDGWHPTEICYNQYYVPVIEAWMKTL